MKKLFLLILCLLLSSCSYYNENNLKNDLDVFLNDLSFNYNVRVNHICKYFDYYLPSDMHEVEGTDNAAIIEFNGSKLSMNLNIAAIVKGNKFYTKDISDDGFFNSKYLVYSNSGSFNDNTDSETLYTLNIYSSNDQYAVCLYTSGVNFYCFTSSETILNLVRRLFIISKSVLVDREAILKAYSNEDVIDYSKSQIDLFEQVMPTEGYLSDLVNSTKSSNTNESK